MFIFELQKIEQNDVEICCLPILFYTRLEKQ